MAMRIGLVLAILGATVGGSVTPTRSGEGRIVVLAETQISEDDSRARHVESVLAVNPRDPNNLIAAAISFGEPHSGIAIYFSRDGGHTWGRAAGPPGRSGLFDGLDPALAFDSEGSAFFLSMAEEGVPVWASADGGEHWTGPTLVPGSWDRPWIGAVSPGHLLVVGKLPIVPLGHLARDIVGVATSRDNGATFSFPALLLPAPDKQLLNVVSDLLPGPAGRALIVLQVFGPENRGRQGRQLLTGSYSTVAAGDADPVELRPGPTFHTFGPGWEGKSAYGYGFARLARDSSPDGEKERLYMSFLDAADGYYRVMMATSTDGGRNWSTPLRVSDTITTTDASNPAIAVNSDGVVGVVWNDRRGDPANRCYQLFFAASFDRGRTFTENQRISDQFTCPIGPPPTANGTQVADASAIDAINSEYRFKNGGDTQGIVGLPGSFGLAWIGGGSGVMGLRFTVVQVEVTER